MRRFQSKVYCPLCHSALLADEEVIKRHLDSEHLGLNSEAFIQKTLKQTEAYVLVKSKKCKKLDEWKECNNCFKLEKPVWMYAQSNYGEIYLCSTCKGEVLNRSFGDIDILETKLRLPGSFESGSKK